MVIIFLKLKRNFHFKGAALQFALKTILLGQKFQKCGVVFEKFEGVPIYLFRAPFFEKEITNLE